MEKILGLDLGTNSIGWALRDTSVKGNQITDKGVLTFEKGVGEVKGIETPLVKARTEARSKRRNYQAEKYRKWELLETLVHSSMCPLTIGELDEWRKYKKSIGRKYPESRAFINWLRFDFNNDGKPDFEEFGYSKHESYYLFRMLIVNEDEKITNIFKNNPHIIGRVLYQLVQRRGFRGRDEDTDEAKAIFKGSEKNNTKGVEQIAPLIRQYKTLGAALYFLHKQQNERVRKRYNLRSDYQDELKEICRVQNINDALYEKLEKAIIWQRPLRSQKGLVGYCTFEAPVKENNKFVKAGKKRCPISHPFYEEYRTWVDINNLKISLPDNLDRQYILTTKVYPIFYKSSRDFKLSSIDKELRKYNGKIISHHAKGSGKNKEDDTKVISCALLNSLQEVLGDNWKEVYGWDDALKGIPKKQEYNIEDIWHILFTFDSQEKLLEFAVKKLELTEEKAIKFSKIKLQQGYATLSLSAIKKMLPYLYKGEIYSHAVYLANLPKVFGEKTVSEDFTNHFSSIFQDIKKKSDTKKQLGGIINSLISDKINSDLPFTSDANYQFASTEEKEIEEKLAAFYGSETWAEKSAQEKEACLKRVSQGYLGFLRSYRVSGNKKVYEKTERLHDQLFNYLKDAYNVLEENKKYLWHPSEQETYDEATIKNGIPILGSPQPIGNGFKNPMALKTLHKLRALLNHLLETGKIDEDTRIVVEIARELNDANKRKAIEKWQREREKQNDEFKKIIDEINTECKTGHNRDDKTLIDKIRLWKEQEMRCLYTGQTINLCDLFDDVKYDLEHTIPASMSFDNELKNLTIADARYNREIKKNTIPAKCPNYHAEYSSNGVTYAPIILTLKNMFGEILFDGKGKVTSERTEDLTNQISFWRNEAKKASTKDRKDHCIQQKHYYYFELEYWRKKLDTFTCMEYKAGWRNSQLKDTQIVTKYALPYLKTVFKKAEVQKGNITSDFRKIYNIAPRLEKKDRDMHTHHAIDAFVLTLIPPAAIRDKILERYNNANDKKLPYHESVRQWPDFNPQAIKKIIEQETLINFQPQYRTLTPTYKNVRKRGKQQFVREKNVNGKSTYKLDNEGNKIPITAKGDTIRGQLHKETFFGAIKQPQYLHQNDKFIPSSDGKGSFIFEKNEKRGDNIFIVTKTLITDFEKFDDFEAIIDPNLKQYLKREVYNRIELGKTFAQAMQNIYAFGKEKDKNGNPIAPLRHIRCKVKGGGGGYINNPAVIKPIRSFISQQQHKKYIYAQNGETTICAFYQAIIGGELIREIEPYSILDISKTKEQSLDHAVLKNIEKNIRKSTYIIPLYSVLKLGQKVLFYENDMLELQQLNPAELSERLYLITKFEDGRISFKHHLNAMPEDKLKAKMKSLGLADVGASALNFSLIVPKLRLSKAAFNFAIEGKNFELKPNGEIYWI